MQFSITLGVLTLASWTSAVPTPAEMHVGLEHVVAIAERPHLEHPPQMHAKGEGNIRPFLPVLPNIFAGKPPVNRLLNAIKKPYMLAFTESSSSRINTAISRHRLQYPHKIAPADDRRQNEQEETMTARTEDPSPTVTDLQAEGARLWFLHLPCRLHADLESLRQARRHADLVILSLVSMFVLIVAIIELYEPATQVCRYLFRREGAIRLETDEKKISAVTVVEKTLDV